MERSLSWVVRKKTGWRGASKRERKGKGGRRVAESDGGGMERGGGREREIHIHAEIYRSELERDDASLQEWEIDGERERGAVD